MTQAFTRSIAALFRSKADTASLRQLEREGIRTVSVLDLDQIEGLVGEAIERELRAARENGGTAAGFVQGAQLEFMKLLGDDRRVDAKREEFARQEQELAANLAKLEETLDQKQVELEQRSDQLAQTTMDELRAQLDAALDAAFQRDGAGSPEANALLAGLRPALRESLLTLLSSAVGRNVSTSEADETEVEQLRRRITKLNAQLAETERLLERARSERFAAEEGIASIYREVQGLDARAKQAELRKLLLREIFDHNVELRRTLGPPSTAATSDRSHSKESKSS